MKKKIWTALLGIAVLGGLWGMTNTAQAATPYKTVKLNWYIETTLLRSVNAQKSINIWNRAHTKKLGNLKTYPNVTWTSTARLHLKHGNTYSWYYRVDGQIGRNRIKQGYVWHGFMEEGLANDMLTRRYTGLWLFKRNGDYNKYVKLSPSQGTTRAILKLFPNSPLTLDLSQIAIIKDGRYSSDDIVLPVLHPKTANYQKLKTFPTITKYLKKSRNQSTAKRIKQVKKLLAAEGYGAAKRKSLKNYQVGLEIIDHSSTNKYRDYNGYAFVVAQLK